MRNGDRTESAADTESDRAASRDLGQSQQALLLKGTAPEHICFVPLMWENKLDRG